MSYFTSVAEIDRMLADLSMRKAKWQLNQTDILPFGWLDGNGQNMQ